MPCELRGGRGKKNLRTGARAGPASDWSAVRIYLRFLHLIGPGGIAHRGEGGPGLLDVGCRDQRGAESDRNHEEHSDPHHHARHCHPPNLREDVRPGRTGKEKCN
eukprot:1193293-Prorocentrum_minimum.AAC.1